MIGDGMHNVVLLDGRVVANDSPAWRDECLARHRHVLNMRRLDIHGRRDYLANVERRDGAEAAQRLRQAFRKDWEARRAAP